MFYVFDIVLVQLFSQCLVGKRKFADLTLSLIVSDIEHDFVVSKSISIDHIVVKDVFGPLPWPKKSYRPQNDPIELRLIGATPS